MRALPIPGGYSLTPYCGAPPAPDEVWGRWNLDPVLLCLLVCGALAFAMWGRAHPRSAGAAQSWAFYAGWLVASLALVSPLCPLSVALFSARVGQHMILTTLAAPLIGWSLPGSVRWSRRSMFPAAAGFALALWFWHAPAPYMATFQSDLVYWLMHATTVGAAVWFWWSLAHGPASRLAAGVIGSLAVSLAMALLGAVITFAPVPLYAPHLLTTTSWGLTPLADQQLGGTIMWVPAGLIFVTAIVGSLAALLRITPSALAEAQT